MRRLLPLALALLALGALAGTASAATPKPIVTSISPAQVPVGGTLVLKGKNFRSGARNNRVFLSRSTDGKSVRVRPKKASKTRIELVVPTSVTKFLIDAKATRFQVAVFTKILGPKTKRSRSPIILPAGAVPTTPGTTPGTVTPPPPPPDCDADGTPDAQDADDDNDGLSDQLESSIKTNICSKDTDGDGVGDAFEYYSALDLNSNALPYPGKRPFANPLDASDAAKDFDGDGLTLADEFAAAVAAGNATSAPLAYSDGNQSSVAGGGAGVLDLDNNGRITDEEKDVDSDGLANWLELARIEPAPTGSCTFFGPPNAGNIFTDCGGVIHPNGNTFRIPQKLRNDAAPPAFLVQTNWLDADSDGDGLIDGADDQDHDDISNVQEALFDFTDPQDPCDPNLDSRTCPTHPSD
jgi:hypothetical protein